MFMNLLLGYLLIGRIVGVMMLIKMVYSRLEDKYINIIQELIGLKFSRFAFLAIMYLLALIIWPWYLIEIFFNK
nr:MAG TPA: hypothetical protein [Bacteriophage sp.]